MCSTAASSFGREGISVAIGWGSHGEARGCVVSSTVAVGGVHWCSRHRSRTRREGVTVLWYYCIRYHFRSS
jgi:hypothetical protein